MPKKKTPELDPKEQFKRFKETAKEAGVNPNDGSIKEAFRGLVQDSDRSSRSRPSSSKRRS